ncbi:AI-2E family transporter [Lacibacter sp. H375]|uniref:AI-2E family transporter n=1 Tax=Lacibacter sp. H375 TaxID=3133424 RepID=UPI0030C07AD4
MNQFLKLPFYVKAFFVLAGVYILVSILSIAANLIVPILFAGIIAVLLSPAVQFLVKRRINRAVAITIILFIVLLLFASLMLLLSTQATHLKDAFPQLLNKFNEFSTSAITWVSTAFNIKVEKITNWIAQSKDELLNGSNALIGFTLTNMGNGLTMIFLIPVYIFMILFYQPHLLQFIRKATGNANHEQTTELLSETKTIIQHYLVGLFFEFLIVAALNIIGLFALGINYALLLGITGALLNIIPYIGGLIALILFMIIALVTKEPMYVIYVAVLYSFIQFVDNNFIVPRIIGAKVKLNALVSLMGVIAGAALWGISGMFLSIPLIAILKLVFDRIESLKPYGFLLGESNSAKIIQLKKK